MTPRRIATLFPRLHISGDEVRVYHLARALDRRQFDHRVLTLVSPTTDHDQRRGPMIGRFRDQGIAVDTLDLAPRREWRRLPPPISLLRDLVRFAGTLFRLVRYLRRNRIEALSLHDPHGILLGALAGRLAGTRAVVANIFMLDFWETGWPRLTARLLPPLVHALVTDSAAMARKLKSRFPAAADRVFLVPNGLHPPEVSLTRREAREQLGIPAGENTQVVAQIGRLVPDKGLEFLLEAAARVLAVEPETWFLFQGFSWQEDGYDQHLRQRATDLGIAHRVLVGDLGPMEQVWAALDLYAHASLIESSPLSILESMALSLPSVSAATGGVPELVEDKVSGLLVPPGDAGALASALLRLLQDPGARQRMGDAALVRFREDHLPQLMARRFGALIEIIIQQG